MECPVCPQRDLPGDAVRCPTCGTDLAPLANVRALAASLTDIAIQQRAAAPKARWPGYALGILSATMIAVLTLAWPIIPGGEGGADPAASPPGSTPSPAAAVVPDDPLKVLLGTLQGRPGLVLSRDGASLLISFDRGIFASGSATVSRTAAAQLQELAAVLRRHASDFSVEVRGYADKRPLATTRWRSNGALAIARAEAAAVLLSTSVRPRAVRTSADSAAPFHDPDGGARSRTVVVLISGPRSEPRPMR